MHDRKPPDIRRTSLNASFVYICDVGKPSNASTKYHIFMLTGNPGCIGYYHEYLSLLWNELSGLRNNVNMAVYGCSLSNFAPSERLPVLGLQGQIDYVEDALHNYIKCHAVENEAIEHNVILVGHSVGAFIGLKLIERHREQVKKGYDGGFRILGYIGLWPTISHLLQSPRGRRIGWLMMLPSFVSLVSILGWLLVAILGKSLIAAVLKLVGFTKSAAEVTTEFLSSPNGVHQALSMAGDEMKEITTDQWNEEIWGAASPSPDYPRPKLVLCFGENDHWVSNYHRDELIKVRGRHPDGETWRPKMMIDDMEIPHSFCIHHSDTVAKRTAEWISEIVSAKH